MKILKKLMLTMCAVAVVLSICAVKPQTAEAAGSYKVTKKSTVIKKNPTKASGTVVNLPAGSVVTLLSSKKGSYYKVKYTTTTGKTYQGYTYSSVLSSASTTTLTKADKIYKRKTTGSGVIKSLSKGAKVIVISKGKTFSKVQYNTSGGKVYRGYIHTNALKSAKGSIKASSSSSSSSSTKNKGTYFKTTQPVNLRSEPDSGSEKIKILPKNGKVLLISKTSKGWYKVSYTKKGKTYTGYVYKEYLKAV